MPSPKIIPSGVKLHTLRHRCTSSMEWVFELLCPYLHTLGPRPLLLSNELALLFFSDTGEPLRWGRGRDERPRPGMGPNETSCPGLRAVLGSPWHVNAQDCGDAVPKCPAQMYTSLQLRSNSEDNRFD